jgi:flagellar hook-basal body complex protein FliE
MLAQLRDMQTQARNLSVKETGASGSTQVAFVDHLREAVSSVNELQKVADSMAVDVASGKSQNLHETMIAATQAELSFNFLVQIRNKVLEAYNEVMRMQV